MPVIAEFESKGLSHFVDEWRSYDCLKGQTASLFMGENCFDGTIVGIDDNGLIQLTDSQGQIRSYASGEVSFRAS
jgi:BirA family biotin operon repressor/biotin-[acetyl-CoA-carboxylase] ligase